MQELEATAADPDLPPAVRLEQMNSSWRVCQCRCDDVRHGGSRVRFTRRAQDVKKMSDVDGGPRSLRSVSAHWWTACRARLVDESATMGGKERMNPGETTPLSTLLARALIAFLRDYERASEQRTTVPPLALWANILRVLTETAVDQRDVPAAASISVRAARSGVDAAVRAGWAATEPHPRLKSGRMVRLTPAGADAQRAGLETIAAVEARWREVLGADRMTTVREPLQALVGRLPLELPHYPTGYGQGDPRPTGGAYLAGDPGPPRVPGHGAEWPVVPRDPDAGVEMLPLPSLLSQALTAFAIDYEETGAGWFVPTAVLLRLFDDDTLPLTAAPAGAFIGTSGKSTLERHRIMRVETNPAQPKAKRIVLRTRGRQMRDAYLPTTAEIERRWRAEFGSGLVDGLREMLTRLVADLGAEDLPHYPPVLAWMMRGPLRGKTV
jgi:DNA-binding MarR family transcriptional regulator